MAHYSTGDPIYALATPYSPSALAVIRASGDGVISLLQPLFSSDLSRKPGGSAVHGYISDKRGRRLDEVLLLIYSSGHGYTGEEAFEIMCHGSLPVIRRISRLLEGCGIREALPGEFTYRAFMHGRLDLTEAEAVEEIVSAKSAQAASNALERLGGNLSTLVSDIKSRLVDILSSLEVQLDYAEDEILEEWVYPDAEVKSIIDVLDRVIGTYEASRIYSQGAMIVMSGANALIASSKRT